MDTPTTAAIELTVGFNPAALPEMARMDLLANAHLNRQTPAERLATLLQKKLGDRFVVKAAPLPALAS